MWHFRRQKLARPARCFPLGFFAAALAAVLFIGQYDPELRYQDRGDRFEGLKPKPVSGFNVELLSARVDYYEASEGWPESMHLLFFLPEADGLTLFEPEKVFVTVRQQRPRTTYYWLDQVRPRFPWRVGDVNTFAWPTATVLRHVSSLSVDDLAVVVRLQRELPGTREHVVPAVLFHSRPPAEVEGYRFTLKGNATAQVTCAVYRGETEVYRRQQTRERAGSPFTVRWRSVDQPEGWYRLVISGRFEIDATSLDKEVDFYHKKVLPAEGSR